MKVRAVHCEELASLPQPRQFQAQWHPEQRPSLFSRFVSVLSAASPVGILAALFYKDKSVLAVSCLFALLALRTFAHSAVGQLIFPAQLIAKPSWSCTERLLINAGLEEALIGIQGKQELRNRKQRLLEQFNGEPLKVHTPDGVSIDAVHFLAPNAERSGPVVLYLNANMQLLETVASAPLIRMYHQQAVNVLLFNYRGVGESTGSVTREGVLIDAESVYQFLSVGLGIPDQKIVVHARSIGGGVGFMLARAHPHLGFCSERSFASLTQVIRAVLAKAVGHASNQHPPGDELEESRCCTASRGVLLQLLMWLVVWLGWRLEAGADAYLRVLGHKWMLYHPHDTIIPFEDSLYLAVCSKDSSAPPCAFRMLGEVDGHNRALSEGEKQWHMQMVLEAVAGLHAQTHEQPAFSYGSI